MPALLITQLRKINHPWWMVQPELVLRVLHYVPLLQNWSHTRITSSKDLAPIFLKTGDSKVYANRNFRRFLNPINWKNKCCRIKDFFRDVYTLHPYLQLNNYFVAGSVWIVWIRTILDFSDPYHIIRKQYLTKILKKPFSKKNTFKMHR